MGLIQNIMKGMTQDKKEFKQKFKQAEEEMRINKMIEERQKSSNERELEGYMKKQREEHIKMQLEKIHKKQSAENWNSKHHILNSQKSIMTNDRPILKEKNIFKDKQENPFRGKGSIFLK